MSFILPIDLLNVATIIGKLKSMRKANSTFGYSARKEHSSQGGKRLMREVKKKKISN